jgi:predicted dehydrogenase
MTDQAVRIGFVGCGRQATAAWYPNFATLRDAYRAMQICEAILDSIDRGEPIHFDLV